MAAEFLPVVADWFRGTYGQPTSPQLHGWQAISEGHHTLIVAPIGSGKTLAAFLWALDYLYRVGLDGRLEGDELPELIRVLRNVLKLPPGIRPVKRIEVRTWDGYPGPRPRS